MHVVKLCRLSHVSHVVNLLSIVGHVEFEAGLSGEDRRQLTNFGKIGYTGLQSVTVFCRLFSSRAYYSDMIYRFVKMLGLYSMVMPLIVCLSWLN